jgi:hypothetical protein
MAAAPRLIRVVASDSLAGVARATLVACAGGAAAALVSDVAASSLEPEPGSTAGVGTVGLRAVDGWPADVGAASAVSTAGVVESFAVAASAGPAAAVVVAVVAPSSEAARATAATFTPGPVGEVPVGVDSSTFVASSTGGVARLAAGGSVTVERRRAVVRLSVATASRRVRPAVGRAVRTVDAVERSRPARSRAVAKVSPGPPPTIAVPSEAAGFGSRSAIGEGTAGAPAKAGIEIIIISWSRRH